jgi:hypothetical protein
MMKTIDGTRRGVCGLVLLFERQIIPVATRAGLGDRSFRSCMEAAMARFRKRLVQGASAAALFCAVPAVVGEFATQALQGRLDNAGFRTASVRLSATGEIDIAGIDRDGMSIGRIASHGGYGWLAPAFAQASGYTIENVVLTLNTIKIEVPRVVVTGASFGKDDIATIFTVDKDLPKRLRGLNAKSVSIPELRITASFPELDTISYVLKNVSADDLVNGKIGRVVIESSGYTAKGKQGSQTGTVLKTEARGVDLVQHARLYFETAPADEPLVALYDSYVSDGMTTTVDSAASVTMEFGKMSSNALRARPLQTKSLEALIGDFSKQAQEQKASGKKPSPQEGLKMFSMVREIFAAFEDDGMSGENIRLFVGDKAKPTVNVSIAKIEGTYGNAKRSAGFKISGIDIKAPDVTAKLGEYSIEGFSYAPTFDGMAQAIAAGDTEFKSIDPRKLIPKLGSSSLKGLEIDAPDPKAPKGIKPERIRLKLGNFSTSASDQINGIPTKINLSIDGLAFKLPETTADAGLKQLKALGYSALDVSARLSLNWSEQNRQLSLSDLSFSGADMGKVRVSADVGNISKDIFEADLQTAQLSLMGATAKSLKLQVENNGLADKLIAMQARNQGSKPDDVRKELSGMASMAIPAFLGNSDQAKALAGAVSGFLQKPGSLKIDLTAKNPAGIGLPDIATVSDPQKALTLVNVTATSGN